MEKINELRDEVYQIAVAHGWHEENLPDQHFLMLIMCEIAEAIEADRKNKHADRKQYEWLVDYAMREKYLTGDILNQYVKEAFENQIKDSVEDELADVVIRCMDLAGLRHIDLDWGEESFKDWDTYKGVRKEEYFKDKPLTVFAYDLVIEMNFIHREADRWTLIMVIELIDAYCKYHGISLEWHVKEKVKYNRGREYKHGKRY